MMRVGEGSSTSLEPVQVYSNYTVEEYKELCASVYPRLQFYLMQHIGQQSVRKLSEVDEAEMRYLIDNISLFDTIFATRIKYAFKGILKGLAEDIVLPW